MLLECSSGPFEYVNVIYFDASASQHRISLSYFTADVVFAAFWHVQNPDDSRPLQEQLGLNSFLRSWYQWHQGFVKRTRSNDNDDCDEILLGQNLDEVLVGHLPKFWKEMEAGTEL